MHFSQSIQDGSNCSSSCCYYCNHILSTNRKRRRRPIPLSTGTSSSTWAQFFVLFAILCSITSSTITKAFQPHQHRTIVRNHRTSSSPFIVVPKQRLRQQLQPSLKHKKHHPPKQQLYSSTVFPHNENQWKSSPTSITTPNHHHHSNYRNHNGQQSHIHWPWDHSETGEYDPIHPPPPEEQPTSSTATQIQSSSSTPTTTTNTNTKVSSPKELWIQKYCTVEGLRNAFGRNRNILWGDLDAPTTRRLYKTLLPVALMDLYTANTKNADGSSNGNSVSIDTDIMMPQDLAPLAYKARYAAKLYARERCQLPARIAANLFDGYRQWRQYGSFDCTGMTYQQVWEKYATVMEQENYLKDHEDDQDEEKNSFEDKNGMTEQICLKILERSCKSNEMIDSLVLKNRNRKSRHSQSDLQQLKFVQDQLERDVRLLLWQDSNDTTQEEKEEEVDNPNSTTIQMTHEALHYYNIPRWSAQQVQKFRALRAYAKFKRRLAALQKHNDETPLTTKQHKQNTISVQQKQELQKKQHAMNIIGRN